MSSREPVNGILGMLHTGFTVKDIDRSIEFYRDTLGFTFLSRQEGLRAYLATITGFPTVYLKIAFLKAHPDDAVVLELLEYTSHPADAHPPETNRPGNGHICVRTPDIWAKYRELAAKGVSFVSPPETITHGANQGAIACYLRDPDGFTVELVQPKPAGG